MDISLHKISGLPIKLSKRGIIFSPKLKHEKVEVRHYKGYEKFFKDQGSGPSLDFSGPLYYIYRNVRFPAHTALFKKHGIRYDITVLNAGTIGTEAIHTVGHIHKVLPRTGRPSELYQVLSGKALFYLQHPTTKHIRLINAQAGAWVHIPGAFGHVTINASPTQQLVIANIFTNRKNASDYQFFKKTHGPAFFPIWNKTSITFEKNPRLQGYSIKKTSVQPYPYPLYPF